MEDFGAQAGDSTTVSLESLESCDLFIGLYAHRYGSRPHGQQSITEMEYDYATLKKIDRLVFIVEKDYRVGSLEPDNDDSDASAKAALEAFKARLNAERVRATFTTPDDLAKQATAGVLRWVQERASSKNENPSPSRIEIKGDVTRSIVGGTFGDNAKIDFGDKH